MEAFIRRNKETISFIAVLIGACGLSLSYLSLRDGQQQATLQAKQKQDETTKAIIDSQQQTRDELRRILYVRGNTEMTALKMVTEYAQQLNGFVYGITPPPSGTAVTKPPERAESKDATKWFADTPLGLRNIYKAQYSRFELDLSAIESLRALIKSLLATQGEGTQTPQSQEQAKRNATLVIAPQLTAKVQSFDPTVRAAALVLCAELFNGQAQLGLKPKDYEETANKEVKDGQKGVFTNKFFGLTSFPEAPPVDLSHFNLANSDFYKSSFRNAIFAGTTLSGTSFEECQFDNCNFGSVNQEWVNAGENPTPTSFVGATFKSCTKFSSALLNSADFSNTKLWTVTFAGSVELNGADFTRTTVLEPPRVGDPAGTVDQQHILIFEDCHLNTVGKTATRFLSAILNGARFERCSLAGALFRSLVVTGSPPVLTSLKGATFLDCTLDGAKFDTADLTDVKFEGGKSMMSCKGVLFGVSAPKRLSNVDLTGAYLADFAPTVGLSVIESGKIDYAYLPQAWLSVQQNRKSIVLSKSPAMALLVETTRDANGITARKIKDIVLLDGEELQPTPAASTFLSKIKDLKDEDIAKYFGVNPAALSKEIQALKGKQEYYVELFKTHEPSLEFALQP